MASILQILRRIGGAKAAPATGKAGELALWKAGAAATDAASIYTHDGAQWVEVMDTAMTQVAASTGVLDLRKASVFTATSGAAITWSFTNVPANRAATVVLTLKNGGAHTQTWPASVKWAYGVAPLLTPVGTDVLVFVTSNGGTTWDANIFARDAK